MQALKQVIVGIDFSESSRTALAQAVRVGAMRKVPVRAVHVAEASLIEQVTRSLEGAQKSSEEKVVAHARFAMERMIAETPGAGSVEIEVLVGSAAGEMVRLCEKIGHADEGLLVLGSVGQGHPSGGVGTTAGRCVRHAPTNVLLVRQGQTGPFRNIVGCVDFSDTSARALRRAASLAKHDGAAVHALHVFSPPPPAYPPGDIMGLWPIPAPDYGELTSVLRGNAERAMGEEVGAVGKDVPGVKVSPVVIEDVSYARGICRYAKEHGADLVVIGTHGRTNLRYMLLGSTAEKVLREAYCSVLAVKPEAQATGGTSR